MTTNFDKLARWDADWYNTLSDDGCFICLTQKERYLLLANLGAIEWFRTRWVGDIAGMDFKAIRSELEYKLSEDMTCEQIATMGQQITNLQLQINEIFQETVPPSEVDNILNNTVNEHFSEDELAQFTVSVDVCDTAGKDAIYGACNAIVRHINGVNIDALQQISQVGNLPQQISLIISATPVGLLPFDEGFEWASFIAEELLDEYEATVTEELLQTCICDLFCIAVANNCSLSWHDLINYYGSKIPSGYVGVLYSLADVMVFAATGTFTGNEYFYYLCLVQLLAVAMAGSWFGIKTIEFYSIVMKTGLNSPDNDWSLLCDECPPFYRRITYDFATGLHGFEIEIVSGVTLGSLDGSNGLKGSVFGTSAYIVQITKSFDPTWRVKEVKMYTFRQNGQTSGSTDSTTFKMRPTVDSDTGSFNPIQGGFRPNGQDDRCDDNGSAPFYFTGANQIWLDTRVSYNGATGVIHLQKVEILFEVLYSDPNAIMTTEVLC